MAFSEALAERVRDVFDERPGLGERKMFGGLCFMLYGNMCCGIVGDALMVRVGPAAYDNALEQAYVRPMDFTGRPMRGMVYVDSQGIATAKQLAHWVELGAAFASGLPKK
jgi:hypothetical protein